MTRRLEVLFHFSGRDEVHLDPPTKTLDPATPLTPWAALGLPTNHRFGGKCQCAPLFHQGLVAAVTPMRQVVVNM